MNTSKNSLKEKESGALGFSYLFNFFGDATFNGQQVTGASVDLIIHVFDEHGAELKFSEEISLPEFKNIGLHDIYQVSYDKEKAFRVEKNLYRDNAFRIIKGWEKIAYEVAGYSIDVLMDDSAKKLQDLPDVIKNLPCSEPISVSEEEFKDFILHHKEFDISDNVHAQVPSYFIRNLNVCIK